MMYRFCNDLASDAPSAATPSIAGQLPCVAKEAPAILLLDGDCRLVLASPAASALLGPGMPLELVFGRLSASDARGAHKLATAMRAVLAGGAASRTLRVGEADTALEVQLVPLRSDEGVAQVIATLRPPGADRAFRLSSLARRFGLTPAEARLLETLCAGASLRQASAHLGVARTTVRTHLQRIFDKSGAHRQADLVRMVLAA